MLNKHILPELGALPLLEVSTDEISAWKARMAKAGVGAEAQRKALRLLRGILQRAVEWKRIPTNEARLVRLPMPRDSRAVRPLPPETVEAIRDHFMRHSRPHDAVLTSVLAYAGLRPQEAHALCWHHVGERTLMIEQRVTNGVIRQSTKNRQNRAVRLLTPVAQDLREFRLSRGRPDDGELIFPARDGGPWNQCALDHWRGRAFKAAREAVGIENATPYTLRHSFASLLIWEGRSPT